MGQMEDRQVDMNQMKKVIDQLDNEIKSLSQEVDHVSKHLSEREKEFARVQHNSLFKLMDKSYVKQKLKNGLAYLVGRRNIKRLYSETYKNKQASNDLKGYLRLLYEEGFVEPVIQDFERLYIETDNKYVRRAVAWELLFWHANKQTKVGAEQALLYFFDACYQERDPKKLQEKAIVASECMVHLQLYKEAEKLLHIVQQLENNDNVLLAKANASKDILKRIHLFNTVYTKHNLEPIVLKDEDVSFPYAKLDAKGSDTINHEEKVSIIVPAYNAEKLIHITLDSLIKQTWQNIEIIVVDDCSSDRTYDIVTRYQKQDKRIKLYQTPENSGAYTARNIGLSHASGNFVTINDADDWSHPRKIEIQMKHLLLHEDVIANTSQLSRVTENLFAYRRGTRGTYIFSNMSSLLFRKKQVMEKLGYWDSVRFAADGEFKRRLQRVFGKEAIVDLKTGPLSLALQSEQSLTASSAFGYHGAFIGARKEYVESFQRFYHQTDSLYYPYPLKERLFPVPKPMLPTYKKGERFTHVLLIADLYRMTKKQIDMMEKEIDIHKENGWTTGLVHMPMYIDDKQSYQIDERIRSWIDGEKVQLIVYGEQVRSYLAINHTILSFEEIQDYLPVINVYTTINIVDEMLVNHYNRVRPVKLREIRNNHMAIFNKKGNWFHLDEESKNKIEKQFRHELKFIPFRKEYWMKDKATFTSTYIERIKSYQLEEGGGINE